MICRGVVVRSVPVSARHRRVRPLRFTCDLTGLQRDRCAHHGERDDQRKEAIDHRIEYTALKRSSLLRFIETTLLPKVPDTSNRRRVVTVPVVAAIVVAVNAQLLRRARLKQRLGGGFPAVTRGIFPVFRQSLPKPAACGAFVDGTLGAVDRDVVTRLRTKCSALALLVGLLAATAGPMFAQDRHPACQTKHHDCGNPARISSCCSGDLGQFRDASVPAPARTELTKDVTLTPTLPSFVQPVARPPLLSAVLASPPRLALLDLPTLFATLLI